MITPADSTGGFLETLHLLHIPITAFRLDPTREGGIHRPTGWNDITWEGNHDRLRLWYDEPDRYVLLGMCGNPYSVVDPDPRNGADVGHVKNVLDDLDIGIYGEIATPGGGAHLYVPSHPAIKNTHGTPERPGLFGEGVDIVSHRLGVYIPGGAPRPNHNGKTYRVVTNDLLHLKYPTPEIIAQGERLYTAIQEAKARDTGTVRWGGETESSYGSPSSGMGPTRGEPFDARAERYCESTISRQVGHVQSAATHRTVTLNKAAFQVGQALEWWEAPAHLWTDARTRLLMAAEAVGLAQRKAVDTVDRALRDGKDEPKPPNPNGRMMKKAPPPPKPDAKEWLQNYLGDKQAPRVETITAAEMAGFKWRTLARAAKELGVASESVDWPRKVLWSMPKAILPLSCQIQGDTVPSEMARQEKAILPLSCQIQGDTVPSEMARQEVTTVVPNPGDTELETTKTSVVPVPVDIGENGTTVVTSGVGSQAHLDWIIKQFDATVIDADTPTQPPSDPHIGPCARCHHSTTRYGPQGKPLCARCSLAAPPLPDHPTPPPKQPARLGQQRLCADCGTAVGPGIVRCQPCYRAV